MIGLQEFPPLKSGCRVYWIEAAANLGLEYLAAEQVSFPIKKAGAHPFARLQDMGYDPVESEYGVNYLKVLSRNPKKTSGDYSLYEHAGFFTWGALQTGGRLVRERKRYERVSGDSANAS
jgi:hypothetical protein